MNVVTLIDFLLAPISVLPLVETAPSISSEQLKGLTDLIKAVGASGESRGVLSPEYLKAVADLISAIVWPAVVVLGVLVFRKQLGDFFGGVQTVKLFGAELSRQLTSELKVSEQEAQSAVGLSAAPTEGELSRATVVERILSKTDLGIVKQQTDELAAEYERIRSSMLPGDARTRRMEVVVSKMRTLGLAAYPLRYELASSPSPGKRLFAIAILQVKPDYDMLDGLAERFPVEKPFVGYHALVAILLAIRDPIAKTHILEIQHAVAKLKTARASIGSDTDRINVLNQIEAAANALQS
jgi:hypothetical protein